MASPHPSVEPVLRSQGEIRGIQYLRGIAATMVVVFHLEHQLRQMGYGGGWLPGLSNGVDIFFVISGFIMWVTTDGRPVTPWGFWRRRLGRIVPLYWLATSLVAVLALTVPMAMQTMRIDPAHIVGSYLFVPVQNPATGLLQPVVIPGWTLNYEMFFYLVFGLCLALPAAWRFWGPVAILVGLVGIGAVADFPATARAAFYTAGIMLEFAAGMALGLAASRTGLFGKVAPALGWLGAGIGIIFIALLPGELGAPLLRSIVCGVAATAVVAATLVLEANGRIGAWHLPRMIGDASYSIYLSQIVTLSAASQAWRRLHLPDGAISLALFCVLATVASLIVGILCHRWVEKPLNAVFHGRRRGAVFVPDAAAPPEVRLTSGTIPAGLTPGSA